MSVKRHPAAAHDVQVVVGHDTKKRQYLIQHLTVLRSYADTYIKALARIRLSIERLYNRRHFDGLGSCSDNDTNALHRLVVVTPEFRMGVH